MLPAASTAWTMKVCEPLDSPVYSFGLLHAAKAALSSLHSNVGGGELRLSNAEKVKVASALLDTAGGLVSRLVTGAHSSVVQKYCDGEASTFPTISMARALNVQLVMVKN